MNNKTLFTFIFVFIFFSIQATEIIERRQEFKIINKSNAEYSRWETIAITSEKDRHLANLFFFTDNFIELRNFKAQVTSNGKTEKFSKKDLINIGTLIDASLFSDNRTLGIILDDHKLPFEVSYEVHFKYKGLLYMPDYYTNEYDLRISKNSYTLIFPNDFKVKYKLNGVKKPEQTVDKKNTTLTWHHENKNAIPYEPYMPASKYSIPHVVIDPVEFEMEGYKGNTNSWVEFGQWVYTLKRDRNNLSDKTQQFIKDSLITINGKRERIKQAFKWMQQNKRYISVQIGIGGWQPFDALMVDELGYGDCKALCNFLVTVLHKADIEAYYCLVKAGKKVKSPTQKDYVANNFNHIIVACPLEKDTIWLECTDKHIPFNYLGLFTSNRYALAIKDKESEIVRTPNYENMNHTLTRAFYCDINPNSSSIGFSVNGHISGLYFDKFQSLLQLSNKELKEYFEFRLSHKWTSHINKIEVASENIDNLDMHFNLEFDHIDYLKKVGDFYVTPILPARDFIYAIESNENRVHDIELLHNTILTDTIVYTFSKEYEVSDLPQPVSMENDFGSLTFNYSLEENQIRFIKSLKLNKGLYSKDKYEYLQKLLLGLAKLENTKMIIKKAQ